MSIQFICPHCSGVHAAGIDTAGKSVRCPDCRSVFTAVPLVTPTIPATPAPTPVKLTWMPLGSSATGLSPDPSGKERRRTGAFPPPRSRKPVSLWLVVGLPVAAVSVLLATAAAMYFFVFGPQQATEAWSRVATPASQAPLQDQRRPELTRQQPQDAAPPEPRPQDDARQAEPSLPPQRPVLPQPPRSKAAPDVPPAPVSRRPLPPEFAPRKPAAPPSNSPAPARSRRAMPTPVAPPSQPPPPPAVRLTQVAAFDMYTDAVISADSRTALLAYPGSKLRYLDCTDFKFKATYRLPHEAYRLALDTDNGILYAVCMDSAPTGARAPRDLHAPGNLYAFDVRDVLTGKGPDNTLLTARYTVPIGGRVATLLFSRGGGWVYFLDVDHQRIGRVDTARGRIDTTIEGLDATTECLCLSPNGKTLYAASHEGKFDYYFFGPYRGTVQQIHAASFRVQKSVKLRIHPIDVQATDNGLVFLTQGSGQNCDLVLVDMNTCDQHSRWTGTHNSNRLGLSPDQKLLFISNWASSPASITADAVPTTILNQAQQAGSIWGLSANFSTRGELRVSPDGHFLLCDTGRAITITP
jgi:hypothetical protein